jgi:acyl-[acyl carrier protein]--UDP-N-acetylglucosamine O-acyltransferase
VSALSVEQYACLEAELAARSGMEAMILQRYSLDAAGLEALRRRYEVLLSGDAVLQERFSRLLEHYRSSLGRR